MVEQMTLQEVVTRRLRDYGYRDARDLADIIGVHVDYAEWIMSGKQKNVGIETRRALARAWTWTRSCGSSTSTTRRGATATAGRGAD